MTTKPDMADQTRELVKAFEKLPATDRRIILAYTKLQADILCNPAMTTAMEKRRA